MVTIDWDVVLAIEMSTIITREVITDYCGIRTSQYPIIMWEFLCYCGYFHGNEGYNCSPKNNTYPGLDKSYLYFMEKTDKQWDWKDNHFRKPKFPPVRFRKRTPSNWVFLRKTVEFLQFTKPVFVFKKTHLRRTVSFSSRFRRSAKQYSAVRYDRNTHTINSGIMLTK